MAIDFGTKSSETEDSQMDKAMANLTKFSEPIFELTAKEGWGGTKSSTEVKPGDPVAAMKIRMMAEEHNAVMRANTPTMAETLLGGVQGALSGMSAGGSVAGALGAESSTLGKALGGVVGAFTGSSAYASGRAAGMSTLGGLNAVAKGAAEWERATKVQIANDAVASFAQRMGEFSHPTNPKQAVEFAAQKDKIVSETAQSLVVAGVAPDKALQTAQMMAAIHDPSGRYSDAKTQAATALSEFYAGPQGAQDKAMLRNKLNTIIMGEAIRTGKMPANATSMLFGSGAGSAQPQGPVAPRGPSAPGMPSAPPQSIPQGPVYGPQPAPPGQVYAGNSPGPWAPSAPKGGTSLADKINNFLGPFGNPMSQFPGGSSAEAAPGPVATPSSGGAGTAPQTPMPQPQQLVIPNTPSSAAEEKQAFGAQNAWKALDKAEALILSDMLPDGMIEAAQANFSKNGLDMSKVLGGAGTAIGGLTAGLGSGGAGALPGAMVGGGIGTAVGSAMGKVGEGASWGMSDEREIAIGNASQLKAQLQTHLGQLLGSNSAGRSEDMKDIINAALGIQGDSIQERLAAIQILRDMVQESANEIGAFSEEKKKSGGNIAKARAPQPGMFFFE